MYLLKNALQLNKRNLSERDTPTLRSSRWDVITQISEAMCCTKGRIFLRGKLVRRGIRLAMTSDADMTEAAE